MFVTKPISARRRIQNLNANILIRSIGVIEEAIRYKPHPTSRVSFVRKIINDSRLLKTPNSNIVVVRKVFPMNRGISGSCRDR
jgi:hypothetical protein